MREQPSPEALAFLIRETVRRKTKRRLDASALEELVRCAYFASMRTEEARPILSTLAFADPKNPDPNHPGHVRHHRPHFTPFEKQIPLTVRNLAKLAPIAQTAALAIAVYGSRGKPPFIWGLVDQEVHQRRTRVFEDDNSFGRPGVFEVEILGIGHVGAYSDEEFIGELRGNRLITRRLDALRGGPVFDTLFDPAFDMVVEIQAELGEPFDGPLKAGSKSESLLFDTIESWTGTICRILHRIQRYHHGGALLIQPKPSAKDLSIKYPLTYSRLSEVLAARIRTDALARHVEQHIATTVEDGDDIPSEHYLDCDRARFERGDAGAATDGGVAFVAALSQVDGLILLGPGLVVRGFGVEITTRATPDRVYSAGDDLASSKRLRPVDISHFGTRHRSMFRYCDRHPGSIGFVVSQDGDIRAIMRVGRRTVIWENLNLYKYERDGRRAVRFAANRRL